MNGRWRRMVALALVVGAWSGATALAQPAERVHSVRRLGTSARMTAPIRDVEALRRTFGQARVQADLGVVLNAAGLGALEADVRRAIADGAVREVTIAPGATFQWMAMRPGGRATILRLVRWDGPRPFPAFEFVVEHGGERFTFLIPQDCGNLTLVSRAAVPTAAAPAVVAPAAAPAPTPAPPAAAAPPPPPPPPAPAAAEQATVAPPPPPAVVERDRLAPFLAVFGGKQRRQYDENDPAGLGTAFLPGFCDPLVGAKGGLELPLGASRWVVAPAVGVAVNLDETERTSLFVDAELNYRFDNGAYLGTGVGLWDLTHSDSLTPTGLLHAGVPLWRGADAGALFFVAEGRILFDRVSDIDSNYQVWGGLRYRFR